MKQIIFLTAALFAAIAGFSQKSLSSKTIHLPESVATLTVESTMKIVLTDDASSDIRVVGDASNLSARMSDGELSLAHTSDRYQPEITVFIPAASLRKVRLNADVNLSSASVLGSQRLQVVMASESTVNIRSKGQVDLRAEDGFSVRMLK